MTPVETSQLLAWLSAADGRHQAKDAGTADAKVRVWSDLLADVPAQFAVQHARRYYSQTQQRDQMLSPGMIRSAWLAEYARQTAEEDRQERQNLYRAVLPMGLGPNRKPDWFDDLVKECDAARARGEDPVPVAAAFRKAVHPGTPETRFRSCRVDICQCTHTECMAGWLDKEETQVGLNGLVYPVVKRCPMCQEAMDMKGELASTRRPRR